MEPTREKSLFIRICPPFSQVFLRVASASDSIYFFLVFGIFVHVATLHDSWKSPLARLGTSTCTHEDASACTFLGVRVTM